MPTQSHMTSGDHPDFASGDHVTAYHLRMPDLTQGPAGVPTGEHVTGVVRELSADGYSMLIDVPGEDDPLRVARGSATLIAPA